MSHKKAYRILERTADKRLQTIAVNNSIYLKGLDVPMTRNAFEESEDIKQMLDFMRELLFDDYSPKFERQLDLF